MNMNREETLNKLHSLKFCMDLIFIKGVEREFEL